MENSLTGTLKSLASRVIATISPSLFFRLAYFHNRKRFPNIKAPKDISEIWIKWTLDGGPKRHYHLADKFKVRKHITEKNLCSILVPILGVYNSPEEIDFSKLPERFALKLNYGANMNIICTDKATFNIKEARAKLNKWINMPVKYSMSKTHYNLISRKIIAEEFIDSNNGRLPTDYKIIVIKGHPFCILACTERTKTGANFMPFSTHWEPLPHYNKDGKFYHVNKPKTLTRMIEIAKILATDIPLVRIDLYESNGNVLFGEITLTPSGCIFHSWSQKALDDMGRFYNSI